MIKQYEDCTPEEQAEFDKAIKEIENKEFEYFKNRGFDPLETLAARSAFKSFLEDDSKLADSKPFDKAPGFRRMWMLGYLKGRE